MEASRDETKDRRSPRAEGCEIGARSDSEEPDPFDIAYAMDALSCVESGDPGVIDLIGRTAYDLKIDGSSSASSSTSSDHSIPSLGDEDVDLRELDVDDWPVDPSKVAALSSAFSSHHISPKKSILQRVRKDFNHKMEPRQMAQFLLPLFTSSEDTYDGSQSSKIEHEDIFRVLTETSNPEPPDPADDKAQNSFFSSEDVRRLLLQLKRVFASSESHNFRKTSRSSVGNDGLAPDAAKESNSTAGASTTDGIEGNATGDGEGSAFEGVKIDFLERECCNNKYLADGSKCPKECHKKWEYVKNGLRKYATRPNFTDSQSDTDNEPHGERCFPQMVFDCDSLNTGERFLYGRQNYGVCPGGCANSRPCKRFSQNMPSDDEKKSPRTFDDNRKSGASDEEIKFIDMQGAWHELKILLLWLYWISNRRLDNFEDMAIGFQISCNCCYCFHANIITRLERLKCFNLSVKESNSLNNRCTCRKKKVVGKGRNRAKTRFKSDLHGKDSGKCQFCLSTNESESKPQAEPMKTKLAHYFKLLDLPVVKCCCQSSQFENESTLEEELSPVFVCSKKEDFSFTYVDLLSGEELTYDEITTKVPSPIQSFYMSSWENMRNEKDAFKALGSDYTCQRCCCTCTNAKFYSVPDIVDRITDIIDNFTRLSMPFLLNKMDTFYSALCARYGAHLLALFSSGCGFTFLKELSKIVRSIRECGLWLILMLGPSRSRLAFTIYFILPGQHFLNSIYWRWADVPALDQFLKLAILLFRGLVPPDWKNILLSYLDIIPYLYDGAILSDISDIFSYARQDFDKDEHLFKMYRSYLLIQKRFSDKLISNKFNSLNERLTINSDSLNFSRTISELIKTKQMEIDILTKFHLYSYNDFEKLLSYSIIKSFAVGDLSDNQFINLWIKKVFCSCDDPDISLSNFENVKDYLKMLIDSMACHKNIKTSKDHISINQILMDTNVNRIKRLIKAFETNHSKYSESKWLKTNISIPEHINKKIFNMNKTQEKPLNDQVGNDNVTTMGVVAFKISPQLNQKFKAVNVLVDFFNSLYNNYDSQVKPKSVLVPEMFSSVDIWKDFHKKISVLETCQKDNLENTNNANTQQRTIETDINEDVNIPENFNYESPEETIVNSDVDEVLPETSKVPNQNVFNTNQQKDIQKQYFNRCKTTVNNFDDCKMFEKWLFSTALFFSELGYHKSDGNKVNDLALMYNSIIIEFVEKEQKNFQIRANCSSLGITSKIKDASTGNNTKPNICSETTSDRIHLQESDLFNDLKIEISKFFSLDDDNLTLESPEFLLKDKACPNNETDSSTKTVELKSETKCRSKCSTLLEMNEMYDSIIFDSKNGKSDEDLDFKNLDIHKSDHSWDPSIEEVEEEMLKFKNRWKTKEDFEQDVNIVCFQLMTRNMLQELMPLDKELADKEKRKVSREKKRSEVVQRKRRLIDGFAVDDYWVSIKSQFEKWRIIAMKMYTNLLNISKMNNNADINIDFQECFQIISAFMKRYRLAIKLNRSKNEGEKSNSQGNSISLTEILEKKLDNYNHNIYVATWFYALKEIERFEKQIKGNKSDESGNKNFNQPARKQFEEIREAELLGGKGLSKMISKVSTRKTPEVNSNCQNKKDNMEVKNVEPNSDHAKECVKTNVSSDTQSGSVDSSLENKTSACKASSDVEHSKSNFAVENKKGNLKILKKKTLQTIEKNIFGALKNDSNFHDHNKHHENTTHSTKENDNKNSRGAPSKDSPAESSGIRHHQDCHEKCVEGKCPLHGDSFRVSHVQSGENPCNCCYCTVFGQVPPLTSPVSRNFNETRERLRTILNKKKLNQKSSHQTSDAQSTVNEADLQDKRKTDQHKSQTSTQSGNSTPNANVPEICNKDISNKSEPVPSDILKQLMNKSNSSSNYCTITVLKQQQKANDANKAKNVKESPQTVLSNSKSGQQKISENIDTNTTNNPVKNIREPKKTEIINSNKVNSKAVSNSQMNTSIKTSSDTKAEKPIVVREQSQIKDKKHVDNKSTRCHSCNRVESKGIQTDTVKEAHNSNKNPAKATDNNCKTESVSNNPKNIIKNSSQLPTNKSIINTNNANTVPIKSVKSRDNSFCASSSCSGCCGSTCKDDRDVNMLVKFIEEPHRAADKEKKQAKKARQRNKKLRMELLKERDELHEDLISMVGETSRLREEVVRLEQGLASACRRLPPSNKCFKRGSFTELEVDELEDHEYVLLLKQAAQEASARATEAATLAEHAHSRLRHVESALNMLSSSVSKACVRQQKLLDVGDEQPKKPKSVSPQSLSSIYNMERSFFKESILYPDEGMVTIKRVILPNSEEPGVTITPKGSDHLLYASQDHPLILNSMVKSDFSDKQTISTKKQNLSWESTIAQINALAHSKKKAKKSQSEVTKSVNSNGSAKDVKTEIPKKKSKETEVSDKTNSVIIGESQTNTTNNNMSKKSKNNVTNVPTIEKIEEMNLSKKALKKLRKAAKEESECSLPSKIDNTKMEPEKEVVKRNTKTNVSKKTGNNKVDDDNTALLDSKDSTKDNKSDAKKNNGNVKSQMKTANLKSVSKTVTEKSESNKNNNKDKISEKTQKSSVSAVTKENVLQSHNNLVKGKKQTSQQKGPTPLAPQKSNNQPSKSSSPSNQNTPLQIMNSLSSAVDKIKLNDDTTIELASTSEKKNAMLDSDDNSSNANKNAPVSSSIMEQLRSGVQFADLRLPPGITLTRVDPSKQHTVTKPNIPLMTSATPPAYRPTPPAPPPAAVIMVDTTKLHADRESKAQAPPVDLKKNKKRGKKKSKKGPHPQQTSSTTSTHTSSISVDDPPKMVTLRNPMFHSSLAASGMPTLQSAGKRSNDMRMPDPIPMPPNASCQATITPTSNGMYTIRNPLMSIVHQQSMMGMNSLDNVPNPLLLMANQHLNASSHSFCGNNVCDDQTPKCETVKNPVHNLTSKMSKCNIQTRKDEVLHNTENFKMPVKSEHSYSLFKPTIDNFSSSKTFEEDTTDSNIDRKDGHLAPNPIGGMRIQDSRKNSLEQGFTNQTEVLIQKPIGTPFTQYNSISENQQPISRSSSTFNQTDLTQPQKLYTPFGPTDADKTFGSVLYQPFSRDQDNKNIWSNKQESDCHYNEDTHRMSPFIQTPGPSRTIVNSENSTLQLDPIEQPKSRNLVKLDDTKNLIPNTIPSSMHTNIYQQPYESVNPSKLWNNGVYPLDPEYYKYYGQFQTGVSPLHNTKLSHSSSSSCVPSDSSSVYDSISNSSSNSPADSNANINPNHMPEYPYMLTQHQIAAIKSGNLYNPGENNYRDICGPSQQENLNKISPFKNTIGESEDKSMNMWKESMPQMKDTFGIIGNRSTHENIPHYDGNVNTCHDMGGVSRMPNGLIENEKYYADSSSVFAPDQSITNLNELDSSERDIESFKRFDYYFEPPKNKPKISLNVQDITFQRPSSTKPLYKN